MSRPINDALWQQLTQDITTEMRAWRLAHPKATLREMEVELDARLNRMRARMLEDLAVTSRAAAWAATPAEENPRCAACDQPLEAKGAKPRTLQTHGGQALTIERTYGVCPACGAGLFPPR
jgi:YgiT-type zinc finger domain-containing protein